MQKKIPKIVVLLFLMPAFCYATSLTFTTDGTIDGGTYYNVTIMNTAVVGMTDGVVTHRMYVRNLGVLNFYNGTISEVCLWDSGVFNLDGASFGNTLSLNHSSTFNLSNGMFDGLIYGYDYSHVTINGGQASGIEFDMSSYAIADIYAGNVTIDFLDLHQYSTLNIYGGDVLFNNGFWLDDDAEINVFYSSIIRNKPEDPYSLIIGYHLLDGSEFMLDQFEHWEIDQINFVPEPTLAVNIDIKPGSCPNPLNVESSGVLTVAILGTEDVNVIDIVIASIRLADPNVAPIRNNYEDVAAPVFDANDCNCTTDGPDGFLDLTLKFETQRIVEAIGDVNHGDILTLMLTGVLFDETPIEGADCILIRGRHKPFNKADINKDGVVDTVDFNIFAKNWLQSSIVDD